MKSAGAASPICFWSAIVFVVIAFLAEAQPSSAELTPGRRETADPGRPPRDDVRESVIASKAAQSLITDTRVNPNIFRFKASVLLASAPRLPSQKQLPPDDRAADRQGSERRNARNQDRRQREPEFRPIRDRAEARGLLKHDTVPNLPGAIRGAAPICPSVIGQSADGRRDRLFAG